MPSLASPEILVVKLPEICWPLDGVLSVAVLLYMPPPGGSVEGAGTPATASVSLARTVTVRGPPDVLKIGRASCRERGERAVVAAGPKCRMVVGCPAAARAAELGYVKLAARSASWAV